MKFANDYPLYRLLVPMILGIIVGNSVQTYSIPIGIIIFLFLFVAFWAFRPSPFRKYSWRFISGLIISILFFLLGFQLLWVKTDTHLSNHYSCVDSVSHFVVTINTPLIERENSFKTVVNVTAAYQTNDTIAKTVRGKIILYFDKECKPALKYGDELLIANNLQIIRGFGNPYEFDYASYLKKQNINHSMYLIRTDWIRTYHSSPNFIIQLSIYTRNILLDILREFDFSEPEFAVASAILLGYDDYLDQDLRQLYSGSGAMHILCVSGLHVGIIFLMFNTLLAFIKRYKYGNYIHAFLIILIIWMYAMITGLSPSVFRSATMFSFITIGGIMNRKTSTYNSLAASAFVLLISNPFLLFHIGFQLSYMAVLSILFFQPHLSALFKSRWWLIKKSRDLIAVSIAAQLGTFPLAIYYFHQFPNYFIITNLLVIPLSFVILIGGFANIFVYLIGLGSSYLGFILTQGLYYSLRFLNYSLGFITELPLAVSENLFFTPSDTLLVYLIIIFFSLFLIYRKVLYLILTMSTFIILFGLNAWHRYDSGGQAKLVIYHVPKHSLIDIIYKNESYLFADSLLHIDTAAIYRYTGDFHLDSRIKAESIFPISILSSLENKIFINSQNHISYLGKHLLIIDHEKLLPIDPKKYKYNYLLLRNNPKLSVYTLDSIINFDTLIIDASNKYWNIKRWEKQCDSLHIQYWNIKEKGAFVLNPPLP